MPPFRRDLLRLSLGAAPLLAALVRPPPALGQGRAGDAVPAAPVLFLHGNGDHAALWLTTLWRFESNGWPRELLHAVNFPDPLARDDDAVPQAGRSSSAEQTEFLAREIAAVLARTGAA